MPLIPRPLLAVVLAALPGSVQAADLELRSPLDWQVVQRHSSRFGAVPLAGEGPVGAVVEWRVAGDPSPGLLPSGWHKIASAGARGFATTLTLPAGGWYRLEVRALSENVEVARTVVEHVGVGEVLVVAGQSNSANHGEERQNPRSGRVVAFDGLNWRPARDPQPGASGDGGSFLPPLGDALAERFGVPIGFVALGVGATSVREWLPAGTRFLQPPTLTGLVTQLPTGEWAAQGSLFTNLTARLRQFGPRGVRAVLWHQGESDANQPDPARTLSGERYRELLAQLISDSRRGAGWEVPWFVAQASYHTPDDPGSPEIRAAQKALADSGVAFAGPDTDALTGQLREAGGQGVHFSGPGLREHAARWAGKLAPWLEQQLEDAKAEPASNASGRP